jgi:outer membrane receptor protein involved in Fe transport
VSRFPTLFDHASREITVFRRTAVALALAFAVVAPAAAQDPATRPFFQDTVHVASSKLGSRLVDLATSATVVTGVELRQAGSRSIVDALAGVPGAHLLDQTGSGTFMLLESRGFASQGQSSHVLVLVDEVPINEVEGDRVDWSLLATPQVERIEFLRGPASFLYGNPSMAGVVNIVTRRGPGRWVWAEGAGGSEGQGDVAGGAGWSGERASGTLSGSFRNVEGYRENSAFRGGGGTGSLRARLGDRWSGRVHALVHDSEQQVPGPLPDPDWRDRPETTITPDDDRNLTTISGGLELSGPLSRDVELLVQAGLEARDFEATETIIPVGAMDRSSESIAQRGEARVRWRPEGASALDVLVGAEVRNAELESAYHDPAAGGTHVGGGNVERLSGGVFGLARVRLAPIWTLTAGARVDWLRSSLDEALDDEDRLPHDDLRAISPTVGLTVALPGSGSAYVSYARAFKAPALDQLYDQRPYVLDFDGPGGNPPFTLRISNNALQPQRGHHVDVGLRRAVGERAWVDGAVYYARSTDEIGFDLANFRTANIEKSVHVGFEGQATWSPVPALDTHVAYAFTRAGFDGGSHDGQQINTVPEQQVSARIVARHGAGGALSAEVEHVADQWLDEDNRYEIEPYTVVNVGISQPIAQVELFGGVRNLFDERYASLGFLTLDQFGADLPLRFPGATRTFQAGIRWRGSSAPTP